MHVLVTGHTGFKGAWLTLLLRERGHTVSGIALDPLNGALFETAELRSDLEHDIRLDIRDAEGVVSAILAVSPDVVVHMAAQPLVRESYRQPRYTFETNVNGTLNVLAATSQTSSVKAQLIVTTDKVYRNSGKPDGYREEEPLGGDDPYSASKAMADLLTQSWVRSTRSAPTGIVRAGNVIGAGDVSPERLLPDLIRAFSTGRPADIRYPAAVRPWQHVLDCLNGYLLAIQHLLEIGQDGIWNIGPSPESFLTVSEMADVAVQSWGATAAWRGDTANHPAEAAFLTLDAGKARAELGWSERLTATDAVRWTLDLHRNGATPQREAVCNQIREFEQLSPNTPSLRAEA